MKRLVFVLILMIVLLQTGIISANSEHISDWAKDEVNEAISLGFIPEKLQNNYNENITREEFVKLVVEAFKIPVGSYEVTFSDVDKTRWSYECISAAASGGIIGGTGNGKFSPEDCITREDMAVIIIKVKELSAEGNNQTFADEGDISAYATGAVHSLARRGIINGFGDSTFRPKEFATRSQAAKIICAMLDARY